MAGLFVAEGDIVVERALAAGYQLQSILIDAKRNKPLPDVIDDAIPVYAAGPEVLQRITGYHLHRGMLACFIRRELLSFDEAVAGSTTVAVIEGVNNPTNLGVILRCAIGLGIDSYYLDPSCCDPLYRRCARVAMGESFKTPYARLESFPEGLETLRQAGFELLALTPADDAVPLNELRYSSDDKVAIVLGAEGPGLTDAAMAACDRRVKIPMAGGTDSINVGSAAAVAFYAITQSRYAVSPRLSDRPDPK